MSKKRQSQAWKDLERKVARVLGGKRNYRGANFSESREDVTHPIFSPECKYTSSNRLKDVSNFIQKGVFVELNDSIVAILLEDFVKCVE